MTRVLVRVHDGVMRGVMRAPYTVRDISRGTVVTVAPECAERVDLALGTALSLTVAWRRPHAVYAAGNDVAAAIFEPAHGGG